jgi:hypothetical protein
MGHSSRHCELLRTSTAGHIGGWLNVRIWRGRNVLGGVRSRRSAWL